MAPTGVPGRVRGGPSSAEPARELDGRRLRRRAWRGVEPSIGRGTLDGRLPHDEVTRVDGIPATTVPRTLLEVTREELEARFREFVVDAGLPRPRVNLALPQQDGRLYVADFAWPDQKLIVELDGHATHATRAAYENDRRRDRTLAVAGWRTVRVTWRQLHEDADRLAADLHALLAT